MKIQRTNPILIHVNVLAAALLILPSMKGQVKTAQTYPPSTKFGALILPFWSDGPKVTQVSTPAAPFFLTLLNRSGLHSAHISLTKDTPLGAGNSGGPSQELKGTDHKDGAQDVTTLIELEPGTYYLTMREQTKWSIKLVVTP